MKKYTTTICLAVISLGSFSQTKQNGSILIKQDTIVLRATDNIMVKSLSKTILQSIQQGKIKALDYMTGTAIPAKKIYTRNMSADTMMVLDAQGNASYKEVQQSRSADGISQIKIIQGLYVDQQTGKIFSVLKEVVLYEEVHSYSGEFIGLNPFCRIWY